MLSTWLNVLTHPKKATFDNQLSMDYATQKTAISWLSRGILLAAIINGISAFIYESIFQSYVGSRQAMAILLFQSLKENSAFLDFVGSPIWGGIISFIGFLIGASIILALGNFIILWLAKILGGKGSFEKQIFATALFIPGLLIVASIFGVIRQIGVCFAFPVLWVYALILSILAAKSIHGLSTTKSAIAVIIPFFVFTFAVLLLFPPHL